MRSAYYAGMRAMLLAVGMTTLAVAQAPPATKPERFSAIMAAGPLSPRPMAIEIGVDRWSTDETLVSLATLFQAGAQAALLERLKKEKTAGYVRAAERERLQAAYVQEETRPDGGRRILLLCVRHPGDWEIAHDAGWTDHPFRIVALTLDATNRGSGILFRERAHRSAYEDPVGAAGSISQ
jgi:hypothetical protein